MENYTESIQSLVNNNLPENDIREKINKVLAGATTLSTIYNQGMAVATRSKAALIQARKFKNLNEQVEKLKSGNLNEQVEKLKKLADPNSDIKPTEVEEQPMEEQPTTMEEDILDTQTEPILGDIPLGEIAGDLPTEPTMINPFTYGTSLNNDISPMESLLSKLEAQGQINSRIANLTDNLPDLPGLSTPEEMDQLAPMREMMARRLQQPSTQMEEQPAPGQEAGQTGQEAGQAGQEADTGIEGATQDLETAGKTVLEGGEQLVEKVGEKIGEKVAEKALPTVLTSLTGESTALDETPIGWLLTAGLGIASLFTGLGDVSQQIKAQAGFQSGI